MSDISFIASVLIMNFDFFHKPLIYSKPIRIVFQRWHY